MPDLIWDHSSPYKYPHANDLYTHVVTLFDDDEEYYHVKLNFSVSGLALIARVDENLYDGEDNITTTYYNLGEFIDTIDKQEAIDHIKSYANYAFYGYIKSRNFWHCPSFEHMADVDKNFNPIF